MLFTTEFLSKVFPEHRHNTKEAIEIIQVSTDTRKNLEGGLFVPLRGESFDAHDFLSAALEKGAVAALWEKRQPVPESLPEGFPLFFVEDTLAALQNLSRQYLSKVSPTVIGVTGSNGKTTTKDLIGAVLAAKYKTHRTAGNYNNHIGLPLTILSMPSDTEALVLEMGMSQFGEIELLSRLANPDFAVITNIGESHIENLGSREGIAKAKMEIMAGMDRDGVIVFDGDEPLLNDIKQRTNHIDCGFEKSNQLSIDNVVMHSDHTTFTIDQGSSYKLGMLGRHNTKNACFAISIARKLDVPEEKIKKALEKIELTGMRFEKLEGKNGSTIINDAYNASPTSMKASIEVIKEMNDYRRKILVLGDIFELGNNAEEMHKTVAEAITPEIEALFTIGRYAEAITNEVKEYQKEITAIHFDDYSKLTDTLQNYLEPESLVLLKASRGMKLEQILSEIQ